MICHYKSQGMLRTLHLVENKPNWKLKVQGKCPSDKEKHNLISLSLSVYTKWSASDFTIFEIQGVEHLLLLNNNEVI